MNDKVARINERFRWWLTCCQNGFSQPIKNPRHKKLNPNALRVPSESLGKQKKCSTLIPTINVTAMDLSVTVNTDVDLSAVNSALKAQAKDRLEGILSYLSRMER